MNRRSILARGAALKLGLAIAVCQLLSGCWDRNELNELGVISAIGVDWEDGQWIATSQMVLPLSTTGNGTAKQLSVSPVDVTSMTGDGIRSAFRKASLESTRRLIFSHNQVVVIGESAARKGIDALLDVILRNMDTRENNTVFLTPGRAADILRRISPTEWNPGNGLRKQIEMEARYNSQVNVMRIFDVISDLLGPAQSTAIPEIRLSGQDGGLASMDALKQSKTEARFKMGRVGVVKQNKLVGWMTQTETYGVSWLRDRIQYAFLYYDCSGRGGKKSSTLRVTKASTKVMPQRSGDRLKMVAKVRAEGVIQDFVCPNELAKPDEVERQEKLVEDEIRAIMTEAWEAARRMKTDCIGFGTKVYERYPRLWRKLEGNWDEHFARMETEIQVDVQIKQTGSSNRTISAYQEKKK